MKTFFDIEKIIAKGKIDNELDFERALVLDRKLRVLGKDDIHYKTLRKTLRDIIELYEKEVWNRDNKIDEKKIRESDLAELIAEKEQLFLEKRKNKIKAKLKEFQLTQEDLGKILGHKSKTHISELINGVSAFTLKDLIILM